MSLAGLEHSTDGGADRYAASRRWLVGLTGLTTVGVLVGVQGFLSGAFDPLVEQLAGSLEVSVGAVLPACALGVGVGLPQTVALALGLRRHPKAGLVGLGAGAVLTGWVLVQLPLIGWTSPVQWVFLAVGLVEIAASILWLRSARVR
ncbi:hypothetical protein ACPPVS_05410 [Cellulomonas sp. McL0617]|uniref:hypothetical protein n=1 Tax=Cellulomonas sp. McL0617 TaxID=3415675 RepID=UPI003CF21031